MFWEDSNRCCPMKRLLKTCLLLWRKKIIAKVMNLQLWWMIWLIISFSKIHWGNFLLKVFFIMNCRQFSFFSNNKYKFQYLFYHFIIGIGIGLNVWEKITCKKHFSKLTNSTNIRMRILKTFVAVPGELNELWKPN